MLEYLVALRPTTENEWYLLGILAFSGFVCVTCFTMVAEPDCGMTGHTAGGAVPAIIVPKWLKKQNYKTPTHYCMNPFAWSMTNSWSSFLPSPTKDEALYPGLMLGKDAILPIFTEHADCANFIEERYNYSCANLAGPADVRFEFTNQTLAGIKPILGRAGYQAMGGIAPIVTPQAQKISKADLQSLEKDAVKSYIGYSTTFWTVTSHVAAYAAGVYALRWSNETGPRRRRRR